jgi:hypothetical protein
MIEFVKEPLVLKNSVLTMGQYLSIIPFLVCAGILSWAVLKAQNK